MINENGNIISIHSVGIDPQSLVPQREYTREELNLPKIEEGLYKLTDFVTAMRLRDNLSKTDMIRIKNPPRALDY